MAEIALCDDDIRRHLPEIRAATEIDWLSKGGSLIPFFPDGDARRLLRSWWSRSVGEEPLEEVFGELVETVPDGIVDGLFALERGHDSVREAAERESVGGGAVVLVVLLEEVREGVVVRVGQDVFKIGEGERVEAGDMGSSFATAAVERIAVEGAEERAGEAVVEKCEDGVDGGDVVVADPVDAFAVLESGDGVAELCDAFAVAVLAGDGFAVEFVLEGGGVESVLCLCGEGACFNFDEEETAAFLEEDVACFIVIGEAG